MDVALNEPHPAQKEFLRTRKRFNALKCGRRFGKTEICQILIAEIIAEHGYTGYWSPTYKDLYEVWQTTKATFRDIIYSKDEQVKQIIFAGGAKVDFWSMEDPDSGRGRKYHRAIIDECEKAGKFQQAWEQTIRATLTDYAGDGYFLSTPKFGVTYFKKLCKYELIRDDWKTFVYSTYHNPHIDPKEIEEARSLLDPLVFACEYMAEDVDGRAASPFAYQWDDDHHIFTLEEIDRGLGIHDPLKRLIISVDFNLTPFAVSFNHHWHDMKGYHDWAFDEAEIEKGSIPAMIDEIRARYDRWLHSAFLTGDSMGKRGDIGQRDNASNYLQLMRGLKLSPTQLRVIGNPTHENSKADTNKVLWLAKTPGKGVEFKVNPNCKGIIRDFRSVQWDDTKQEIKKANRNQEDQRADLLDTQRSKVNVFWKPIIMKM